MLNEEIQSYKNLKLNDSQCLLVQFLNERKKPVQVGFQAWLKNNENINKEEMIGKEVLIHWPLELDIICAKSMEKKLKSRKMDQDKWQDLVVKIISFGEWTEMCYQAKNIEKFGVPNLNRKQRHVFCKKNDNKSDNSNTNSEEDEQNIRKDNKNKKFECDKIKLKTKINQLSETKKMANSTQKDNKQSIDTAVLSKIENFIKEKENVTVITDSDEDSDKYQFHKMSKQELNYKILVLEEENKKLRLDNARLRTLRCISEDLGKMKQLSSNILRDLEHLQKNVSLPSLTVSDNYHRWNNHNRNSKSETNKSKKKNGSSPSVVNTNVTKTTHSPSTSTVIINDYTDVQQQDNYQNLTLIQPDVMDKTGRQEDHDHNDIIIEENSTLTQPDVMDKTGRQEDHVHNNIIKKEDELNIGGRIIDKKKVLRIDKSKGLSSFTTTLMGIVFTSEEMGTCSMTGGVSNFQKKCVALTEKKQLDPIVKDAFIEYVRNEFKVDKDDKGQLNKIKTAMKSKLNNEATKRKGKTKQAATLQPVIQ